ncbi:putative ATP-grasp target RiPP [Kribbella orskensis]|uniref:ATP-grasp target RiPP n=1 Tax=Kribbella orskensis TaxID=2512216 RepID=A0ABY2B6W4_9ACTN|nr:MULTISPECIES: putative ATP-grasp-modified RiPP [Kribbella]TCN28826.1 putative ATP-grasp target RiPP [Kribbella sp. VKM Ac-2500]TCO08606.1 putative ATP-grasp target RiPP [Kribbella orskensis]
MTAKAAVTPWGLTRVSELSKMVELPYTSVEIDPATQTARYRDVEGALVEPIEAGKHGSATNTSPRTGTSRDGSGNPAPDSDTGHDGDRD